MSNRQLPELRRAVMPAAQKERLARWLHEWQLDRHLRHCCDEDAEAAYRPAAGREGGAGSGPPCEAGQVRLLHPGNRGAWHMPVFVALLKKVGASAFLVAPFSRFAEPALPAELLTGREAHPLRVLCLWNARSVPRDVVDPGWYVDTLAPEEIESALAVCSAAEGGPLPAGLAGRTGPPLVHPEDPRQVYVRRERLRMNLVLREEATVYPMPNVADLPLAAEDRDTYGANPEKP